MSLCLIFLNCASIFRFSNNDGLSTESECSHFAFVFSSILFRCKRKKKSCINWPFVVSIPIIIIRAHGSIAVILTCKKGATKIQNEKRIILSYTHADITFRGRREWNYGAHKTKYRLSGNWVFVCVSLLHVALILTRIFFVPLLRGNGWYGISTTFRLLMMIMYVPTRLLFLSFCTIVRAISVLLTHSLISHLHFVLLYFVTILAIVVVFLLINCNSIVLGKQ